ncbi:unnamed protein product [Prorocentrum cordatum]|uniref:Uncharacterized protein n=1 Tax=Prorocentrum cordatum TaxID=2364126 RepID=A0ABN9VPQ3_9DINO|nr:unnamed protein product [Polarella glacialis]
MLRVAGVGTAQSDDCSLARVEVRVDPPELFEYLPRTPSPLMERCAELGGCELQRLVASPLAIGDVRPMEIPPLCVSLRTRCCGQGFEGAVCSMGGMAPAAFGADGRAEFQRNRRGGEGQVTVTGVPPQFLGQQPFVKYGPLEPSGDVRVEALCPLWVYWVLPEDSEEADAAESADREELAAAAGSVFLAADGQHVPDEAEPFCGVLRCPGARVPELELDGTSAGPHFVAAASDFGDGPGSSCLLASLCVEVRPPEGWEYASRDPPPLAERCGELGGCELQRLAACPVAVGDLKPVPLKPLLLSLRTPCCGRGWAGARCSVAGREPVDFGEAGRVRLPRRRRGGEARATVQGVPAHLLPGGSGEVAFSYTAFEPEGLDLEVLCPIWIYYQPPEEEEGDEGDEPLPSKALVFAAADGEHVPDDALPVSGAIECPGAQAEIVLDGTSMGPFLVRRLPRKPEQRDEEQDCLLGGLRFRICGPPGHTFEPKDPSPLQERCGELGGCELQRLVQCPVVVGFLSPSTTGACAQTSSAAESDDP